MKLDDMVKKVVRAYGQMTDQGLMLGLITNRDVCVTNTGDVEVELVDGACVPTFHGCKPYVRYEISREVHDASGMPIEDVLMQTLIAARADRAQAVTPR